VLAWETRAYRRIAGIPASHVAEIRSLPEERAPETGTLSSAKLFYSVSSRETVVHIMVNPGKFGRPFREIRELGLR